MNWGFDLALKMLKNFRNQNSIFDILAEIGLFSAKCVKSKNLAMKLNQNILTPIYS